MQTFKAVFRATCTLAGYNFFIAFERRVWARGQFGNLGKPSLSPLV